MPHINTVSVSLLPLGSSLVIPSSSVSSANPPSLLPLHPRLYRHSLLGRYHSNPPFLRHCLPVHRGPIARALPPPSSSPSQLSSAPSLPFFAAVPKRPLSVLPFMIFSLLPPAGNLWLLALPLDLLPPDLAADIARRDEDVGNWTGGVVALWWVAVGSNPCGKSPSMPHIVVGDGMIRPLSRHLPQQ